jgi:hypothetical protein
MTCFARGDIDALEEIPAISQMRILGQRYPGLRVVNLAASGHAGP